MNLPPELLSSLKGVTGFDEQAFIAAHRERGDVTSVRINTQKFTAFDPSFPVGEKVPWAETGFYLSRRPSFTFDPLFHAGCYYVQEASSMFLEQAFKQLLNLSQPLRILDLCAAPGGKSTHVQSLVSGESLLVSNEAIRPRSLVLTDNVIKWGSSNVFVTNNDPKAFRKLPGYFDAMVVDAPCSGSGLFRKDEEAVGEWSLNTVALCSQRQRRILADALPGLKENGLLVYSTCSYSVEEDEAIADWLVREMNTESLSLNAGGFDGIVETRSPRTASYGYRFYPDKVKGEGFFIACFRKKEGGSAGKLRASKPETVSSKEKNVAAEWTDAEGLQFVRFREAVFALPQALVNDFATLQPLVNLQYAGVQIGEVMQEKLVPHHALAQSLIVSQKVPAVELGYDDAVRYLQRAGLGFVPSTPGRYLARYAGRNLGWLNVLQNRVNNYYPKELRILKRQNDGAFEK